MGGAPPVGREAAVREDVGRAVAGTVALASGCRVDCCVSMGLGCGIALVGPLDTLLVG